MSVCTNVRLHKCTQPFCLQRRGGESASERRGEGREGRRRASHSREEGERGTQASVEAWGRGTQASVETSKGREGGTHPESWPRQDLPGRRRPAIDSARAGESPSSDAR